MRTQYPGRHLALWAAAATCFSLGWRCRSGAAEPEASSEPDKAALVEAGARTAEKLGTTCASWTVTHEGFGPVRIVVDVCHAPGMRRTILSAAAGGKKEEILRITERDGAWYVAEQGNFGKYRPFEAPLSVPNYYLFLLRSELFLVNEEKAAALGRLETVKDGVATYRAPVPEPLKQQIQNMIAEYEALIARNPKLLDKPNAGDTKKAMDDMRTLLAQGIPTKVDQELGLVVQLGAPPKSAMVSGFKWLTNTPNEEFSVNKHAWTDRTGDYAAADPEDLVMLDHCGFWRPGQGSKLPDAGAVLLDVKRDRFWRVPFKGVVAQTGCFAHDRKRVIVAGMDVEGGSIRLYEIDLATGDNRRLGGDTLAGGFTLFPVLSPDGKTVAVLHKGAAESIMESQIFLVDLATAEARPFGKPLDTCYISWLPDGRGLILVSREFQGGDKPPLNSLARMNEDGSLVTLRRGDQPILLNDGKTILFQDETDRLWKTCNLEGKDEQVFGDGMRHHTRPSPAPDGKRLMMLRTGDRERGLVPVMFEIGKTEGRAATEAPGLWLRAAWR